MVPIDDHFSCADWSFVHLVKYLIKFLPIFILNCLSTYNWVERSPYTFLIQNNLSATHIANIIFPVYNLLAHFLNGAFQISEFKFFFEVQLTFYSFMVVLCVCMCVCLGVLSKKSLSISRLQRFSSWFCLKDLAFILGIPSTSS